MIPKCFCSAALAALLAAAGISICSAQANEPYPSKPIKIVLPIPAGTALDVVTRLVSDDMAKRLGQPIVVEARPGAGGLLAAQAVMTAPADGYTLLGGAASIFTILPAQKDNLPIDVSRDFTQIGLIVGRGVMFVAVSPKLGVTNFAEFVTLAKSKPGQIIVGTNAAGTLPHYAALALVKKGGVPLNVVPYSQGGSLAAIADIMGGRVHAVVEAAFGIRGHVQSGDIVVIGAMSDQREPEYPNVPATTETLPGLTAIGFMSLAARAGTPMPIVAQLNDALRQALETPSVKQRFAEHGIPIKILTPEQTGAFVASEQKIWLPLVKELEGK